MPASFQHDPLEVRRGQKGKRRLPGSIDVQGGVVDRLSSTVRMLAVVDESEVRFVSAK